MSARQDVQYSERVEDPLEATVQEAKTYRITDMTPEAMEKRADLRYETINSFVANAQVRVQILERQVLALREILAEVAPQHAARIQALETYYESRWQGAPVARYHHEGGEA